MTAAAGRAEIAELLDRLHRQKDAVYGDAWRRRGEVLGIFANMARKYDRMVIAIDEKEFSGTEPLTDTAADLLVYACKYLGWIAEQDPIGYDRAGLLVASSEASARNGPAWVARTLEALARSSSDPGSADAAWRVAKGCFGRIEKSLMSQAAAEPDPNVVLDYAAKARCVHELADALLWFLDHLRDENPDVFEEFRDDLVRTDRRAKR